MAIAYLSFDLEDGWDAERHMRALKADNAYHILWNILWDRETAQRLLNLENEEELRRELLDIYDEAGIDLEREYT